MGARVKETLFASVVVLFLLFFAFYAEVAVPNAHYNAALVASVMFLSALSCPGVEKISKFAAWKRWIFEKGQASGRVRIFEFHEIVIVLALAFLTGLETSILQNSGVAEASIGVVNLTFGVNMIFLPVFTSVLLGAVNVDRYLDSLATTRAEPLEEGRKHPIPEGSGVRAGAAANRWCSAAGLFVAFLMSFFIVILPLASPALAAAMFQTTSYRAYISAVILFGALAAGYCFFGIAINKHLAACGMKRERDLLGGLRRDDAAFEAHRRLARRAKRVAIASAVVVYPATFYVFFTMLGL